MGDAVNGKKLFMKMCASCHTMEKDGKHKLGPNLHGIMGKTCGTTSGFNFTEAIKEKAIVWDEKTLNEFLEFPQKFIPGTKKTFFVKNAEDRKDLIAFLSTLKF
ncbi:cytochrome c, testis-specific-like [Pogonomyrmex barbatus]|uniref:Cytochrome c, testis-specific-like n=1 Tax=Pogonomyrmex barbatus TaxID=144034 RepID=A0A6I9X3P9_9HYME|nr:cytochrome c, testis-specific-like [Pogonomyrmex barbatus]